MKKNSGLTIAFFLVSALSLRSATAGPVLNSIHPEPVPSHVPNYTEAICAAPTPTFSSGPLSVSNPPSGAVILNPGDNVATVVASKPAGTTFYFNAGVYRMQRINALAGDTFIGAYGADLNGSALLTTWTPSGQLWSSPAANLSAKPSTSKVCDPSQTSQSTSCENREDLFVDNVPYTQVNSLTDLVSGQNHFFYDYVNKLIYTAENPKSHTVEIGYSYSAIYTSARAANVTVKNLIVEKYAVPFQMGAIGDQYPGSGWIVENNEVRLSHGAGINVGSSGKILYNHVHDVGQKGIGISGSGGIVQGNELDHNVYTAVDCGWECGGSKFSMTNNLLVKGNYSHDNNGPGLWTDIYNINTTYTGNIIANNHSEGLRHEISYAATIESNIFYNNGVSTASSGQGAGQITVANSLNVEIKNNIIILTDPTVSGVYGSAVVFAYQDRDTGTYSATNQPYGSVDAMSGSSVHDNDITFQGSTVGIDLWGDYNNGIAANLDGSLNSSNPVITSPLSTRFYSNHYHVSPANAYFPYWSVSPDWKTITAQRSSIEQARTALGQDIGSGVDFACSSGSSTLPSASSLSPSWTPEWTSLAGYWKLNESAGATQITDSSGNENSGTLKGGVTLGGPGTLTTGASFNGTNGYIALPEMTLGNDLTVGAWVNEEALGSAAPIFSVMNSEMQYLALSIQKTGDAMGMTNASSKWPLYAAYGSQRLTPGNWHHLVFVVQGTQLSIYLDGYLDNTRTIASASYTGIKGTPSIGSSSESWSPQWFNGSIDELAVWNTALTASQIETIYAHQVPKTISTLNSSWAPEWKSILGYWKLNDSAGSSQIADSSGNGNLGTAKGDVTLGGAGSLTTGASFNGTNGSIELPAMTLGSDVTIGAWVDASALTSNVPIFSAIGPHGYLSLTIQENGSLLGMTDVSSAWPQYADYGSHQLTSGNWHYVAFVVQGTSLFVYLDGYLDKIRTLTTASYTGMTATTAAIGATSVSWSQRWFNGSIDEVAVWNAALSPAEIQLIYAHQLK